MKNKLNYSGVAMAIVLALSGCGGGGGSSSGGTTTTTNSDGETLSALSEGFSLPSDIKAVPVDANTANLTPMGQRKPLGFASALRSIAAASDLPSTSDYATTVPRKFVEERALEQFDIIEQVMKAMAQTHYADEVNINQGAYTAMVTWTENQNGRDVKTLQPWVVDSRMIVENDEDVNRVLAWIESSEGGETEVIKAEFKVYAPAVISEDGQVIDYGRWTLNVLFDDGFFTASSTTEDGLAVIRVNEEFQEKEFAFTLRGVLHRSDTAGYGRVEYPDFDSCMGGGGDGGGGGGGGACVPDSATAQYAYNQGYLAVKQGADAVVYKDRLDKTEFTQRYGLFFAAADADAGVAAGDNVEKHKSFGFPLNYTDDNGNPRFAYYGAWQGRHEIWGDGTVAAGTEVERENFGNGQAQTYTVSEAFNGTFTMRTLADGSLSDIKDIAVETWLNNDFELFYDATETAWMVCDGFVDWQTNNCTSRSDHNTVVPFTQFTDYDALVVGENDRKWVGIGRWDNVNQTNIDYVYLNADPGNVTYSGAGFYPATFGETGNLVASEGAVQYAPADGDSMWVGLGGSIYIKYTGNFANGATGWVELALESFNESTWTPTFASATTPFSPDQGVEYYINSHGANFVVKRRGSADAAASYEVKVELQTTANPVNYASIIPDNTAYLRTPWRPDVTYELVTDASDDDFLKMKVLQDNTGDSTPGTVVTSGEWGLQAYNNAGQPLAADGSPVTVDEWGFTDPDATTRPVEFNWEYSADGGWGTQQFLIDADGDYVVLSDPIQLNQVALTNNAGDSKNVALQYDGWMHGLPDMYQELAKNDWVMDDNIADKILSIPAGTEVTDTNNVGYYVKPLEISVFLNEVTEGEITGAGGDVPDMGLAATADLDSVPDYTDHGMGAKPQGTTVKYSEGILVVQ